MRRYIWVFLIPVLVLALVFLRPAALEGWERPEGLSRTWENQICRDIQEGASLVRNAGDRDSAERSLLEAGWPVLDTDDPYPAYLANGETLRSFADGEADSFGFFQIRENGELRYIAFRREREAVTFFCADICLEEDVPRVREMSAQPVYELELADWGVFYYRLYPAGDPHYVDYTQIFLEPPDREAWDMVYRYIQPVGYQMVNLFLQDWREGDWGSLAFPDLLEALYQMQTGQRLVWEEYPAQGNPIRRMVPAAVFEQALLPYFALSQEALRRLCGYDPAQDAYPWRPVHGDELVSWGYPMCEPHVAASRENPDGTLTLDVEVWSPELKTNRLFCHELTVRPLAGGGFQYVSNQVTDVGDRGLPLAMPRSWLDSLEVPE